MTSWEDVEKGNVTSLVNAISESTKTPTSVAFELGNTVNDYIFKPTQEALAYSVSMDKLIENHFLEIEMKGTTRRNDFIIIYDDKPFTFYPVVTSSPNIYGSAGNNLGKLKYELAGAQAWLSSVQAGYIHFGIVSVPFSNGSVTVVNKTVDGDRKCVVDMGPDSVIIKTAAVASASTVFSEIDIYTKTREIYTALNSDKVYYPPNYELAWAFFVTDYTVST